MRTKNTENKRQGCKNTRNNTVIDIKSNKQRNRKYLYWTQKQR